MMIFNSKDMIMDVQRSIWNHSMFELKEKVLGCSNLLVLHGLTEDHCELILGDFTGEGIFVGKFFNEHSVWVLDEENNKFISTEEFVEI